MVVRFVVCYVPRSLATDLHTAMVVTCDEATNQMMATSP